MKAAALLPLLFVGLGCDGFRESQCIGKAEGACTRAMTIETLRLPLTGAATLKLTVPGVPLGQSPFKLHFEQADRTKDITSASTTADGSVSVSLPDGTFAGFTPGKVQIRLVLDENGSEVVVPDPKSQPRLYRPPSLSSSSCPITSGARWVTAKDNALLVLEDRPMGRRQLNRYPISNGGLGAKDGAFAFSNYSFSTTGRLAVTKSGIVYVDPEVCVPNLCALPYIDTTPGTSLKLTASSITALAASPGSDVLVVLGASGAQVLRFVAPDNKLATIGGSPTDQLAAVDAANNRVLLRKKEDQKTLLLATVKNDNGLDTSVTLQNTLDGPAGPCQVGDLDGDGLADLACGGADGLRWLPGKDSVGPDAFYPAELTALTIDGGASPDGLALLDLDGNGTLDAAIVANGKLCLYK